MITNILAPSAEGPIFPWGFGMAKAWSIRLRIGLEQTNGGELAFFSIIHWILDSPHLPSVRKEKREKERLWQPLASMSL